MVGEGRGKAPSPHTFNISEKTHLVKTMDILKEAIMIAVAIAGGIAIGRLYRKHGRNKEK